MNKIFYILLLTTTFFGCSSVAYHKEAKLSGAQVLEIAKKVAIQNEVNLDYFKHPRISFQEKTGQWRVSYSNKKHYTLRPPNASSSLAGPSVWAGPSISYYSITIQIDDKTGNTKFDCRICK